jgi:hypothetical protein
MEGQCIGRGWRRIVPRAWQIPQSDKTVAGFKARDITGVFAVENELVVSKN